MKKYNMNIREKKEVQLQYIRFEDKVVDILVKFINCFLDKLKILFHMHDERKLFLWPS